MHSRDAGFRSLGAIAGRFQSGPSPEPSPPTPTPPPPKAPVLTVLDGDGEKSGASPEKRRSKIACKPRKRAGGCNHTGRTGHRILGPQSGGLDALQYIRPDGVEDRALVWMAGRRLFYKSISGRSMAGGLGISLHTAFKIITLWATPNGDTPAWFEANFPALVERQI